MGMRRTATIEAWQQRAGLTPATGKRAETLDRLSTLAFKLIQVVALEKSGIRDGDGQWSGCDAVSSIVTELVQVERQDIDLWKTERDFAEKFAAEFPFGRCPECGSSDGHLNIGRDHWYVCHAHRVRWYVGSNLFSDWRHEDEAAWEANKQRIGDYREVSGDEALTVAVSTVSETAAGAVQ